MDSAPAEIRSPAHAAALEYIQRGWYVFPVERARLGDDDSGKRPLTPHGKDDATLDPAVVNAWWDQWPDASVGIAVEPSRLFVLDVDTNEGKKGRESFAEIQEGLSFTLTANTGGGGLHVYYAADDLPTLQKIGFKPGLDAIGKGYVVAPPSAHWSGNMYTWRDIRPIVTLPAKLRELASAKKDPVRAEAAREPVPQGGRNNALWALGAALWDTGIGREALANALHWENQQRCAPPVDDWELKQIIDSVMRGAKRGRDVLGGAVIAEEIKEIFAPKTRRTKIAEIALEDHIPIRFFSTGFPDLDRIIGGGVATQQVVGIIGPPSSGKSGFAGSLVMQLQKLAQILHVSTELPRRELMIRYAAHEIGFAWRDGLRGKIGKFAIAEVVARLNVELLGCDDLDGDDPLGCIWREAEDMRAKNGNISPIIVIDYVQLLARGSDDQRRARVGEITKQMRVMAQQLDTVVIAVFSSRRDFYGNVRADIMRQSDNPTLFLSAAKESGDIEFDCATLLYLDVDQLHQGLPKPARIAVARCRYGDIGFAGARAGLDSGKWWDDPQAAIEMTDESKKERKALSQTERDEVKLLEVVARMPGKSWRQIRPATGMGKDRADAAKNQLILAGRLESIEEKFYDSLGKANRRTIVRVVGNIDPPPSTPSKVLDHEISRDRTDGSGLPSGGVLLPDQPASVADSVRVSAPRRERSSSIDASSSETSDNEEWTGGWPLYGVEGDE